MRANYYIFSLLFGMALLTCGQVPERRTTTRCLDLKTFLIPWDTTAILEQGQRSNGVRVYLTPEQHGRIFLEHWANSHSYYYRGSCEIAYEPKYGKEYTTPPMIFKPSLFFIRKTEVNFLNAVIAYAWADTVYLNRTYYDALGNLAHADTAFIAPEVTIKLYYKNVMMDSLYPKSNITEPFDRDIFRAVFNGLFDHLEYLTDDHNPYNRFKYLTDTFCFGYRSYADIMGIWEFTSTDGCIEASLSCLPTENLSRYYSGTTYNGAWIWDKTKETYWLDTTVWSPDRFKAKYGRHRNSADMAIFDVGWEDLAITLRLNVGVDHSNVVVEGFTDVEGYEAPFFYYGCRHVLHDLGGEALSGDK